jgi:cellulose synthase/poly-beta-1,6-N-acetylglucosamine synthase-like glycosyltransferase
MEILFWTGLAVIFYTFLGYPLILGLLVKLKRLFSPSNPILYADHELPDITLIVACYNEADILHQKIGNTLQLQYPVDKVRLCFVTDGSTDGSQEIVKKYQRVELFHEDGRKGKTAAVNRVMKTVRSTIVFFCDANTVLNENALILMARYYKDPQVGAVAGEKRVYQGTAEDAAASGEGAYWKYESMLKKWDSELYTVVGAAGELFSVRNSLYEDVPHGVLIEDFRLSMTIASKGYRVLYEPAAVATETASASMGEEHKRKVRISAGGLQEVWHFMKLLNFFKYGWLSFQYVSHRMLRWTLAPLSLLVVFIANVILAFDGHQMYLIFLILQLAFYTIAVIGYMLKDRKLKTKGLFIPYYFLFMNLAVYQGLLRLVRGKQTVVWDKAKRASV